MRLAVSCFIVRGKIGYGIIYIYYGIRLDFTGFTLALITHSGTSLPFSFVSSHSLLYRVWNTDIFLLQSEEAPTLPRRRLAR
jgi:hypothetical protein